MTDLAIELEDRPARSRRWAKRSAEPVLASKGGGAFSGWMAPGSNCVRRFDPLCSMYEHSRADR